ncbi:hypothetical protein H0H93_008285 [Arthromyces matolae]|nr:hypothetical protein H0H93_008285 [Arthromyces matolae]
MYAFPSGSMSTSNSAPDSVGINNLNPSQPTSLAPPGSSTKRHTRLHSRNLSVFFPRPGSLPTASIAEDGSQEVEMPQEAPVASIPSAGLSVDIPSRRSRASHSLGAGPPTPLGVGFTFGARPPSSAASDSSSFDTATSTQKTSRRGHHHKHSLSHSFFSFLEPGSTGVHPPLGAGLPGSGAGAGAGGRQEEILHTQPTPMPLSPWAPMSGFPQSAKMTGSSSGSFPPHTPVSENGFHNHQPFPEPDERDMGFADHVHGHMHGPASGHGHGHGHDEGREWQGDLKDQGPLMIGVGVVQFILGAWLWVSGQQIGSLSVTGLGYWIVFDAFGVGLKGAVMRWLDLDLRGQHGGVETKAEKERRLIRRPYGIAPVQTVLMFGQAVYLLFSSVYICKETFEHLLLSAGNVEGHHHHHGDEDEGLMGIEFPVILALITILSIFGTSIFYSNHARLDPVPTTSLGLAFSNPFTLAPLVFAGLIITVALGVPTEHHRICDLVLAGLITIVTFNLAYRACSVLGTTLLQTAPPRGMPGGKMEAFLRVMREVRH